MFNCVKIFVHLVIISMITKSAFCVSFTSLKNLVGHLETELGTAFARTVTQRKSVRQIPQKDYLCSELHKRWTSAMENEEAAIAAPHAEFHHILGTRILERQRQISIPSSPKLPSPLKYIQGKPNSEDAKEVEIRIFNKEKKNFVHQHVLIMERTMNFPTVLLTLSKRNKMPPFRWFMPIEQALIFPTLKDYRESGALLKTWDPYSTFSLTVLPEGSIVNFGMGLLAPQSFPMLNEDFFSAPEDILKAINVRDVEKIKYFLGKDDLKGLKNFFEVRKGGFTQFYILSAYMSYMHNNTIEDIEVFPLKDLFPSTLFEEKKEIKVEKENEKAPFFYLEGEEKIRVQSDDFSPSKGEEIWAPRTKDRTHFFHPGYDEVTLKLPEALQEMQYINKRECDEINAILKALRESLCY